MAMVPTNLTREWVENRLKQIDDLLSEPTPFDHREVIAKMEIEAKLCRHWLNTQPTQDAGWRPIETAPKDHTLFLAVKPNGHMFVLAGDIYWRQQESPHITPSHLQFDVTHWQHLPPPPKDQP